jgi:hypothetical protein
MLPHPPNNPDGTKVLWVREPPLPAARCQQLPFSCAHGPDLGSRAWGPPQA